MLLCSCSELVQGEHSTQSLPLCWDHSLGQPWVCLLFFMLVPHFQSRFCLELVPWINPGTLHTDFAVLCLEGRRQLCLFPSASWQLF